LGYFIVASASSEIWNDTIGYNIFRNYSVFGHLVYAAKAKFQQLQNIYRPGKLTLEQILARTVTREDVPSKTATPVGLGSIVSGIKITTRRKSRLK